MPDKYIIFNNGSRTYSTASLFFDGKTRSMVATVYAFVRVMDDFVDSQPQDSDSFHKYVRATKKSWNGEVSGVGVVDVFVELCKLNKIPWEWTNSFLKAMESDLHFSRYKTYEELCEYMFGSAEVVGLMLTRIFKIPKEAEETARIQGRAMQLINFVRDIGEDNGLGRQYIPSEDMKKFGVLSLKKPSNSAERARFKRLMRFEISRYRDLQKKAQTGYVFLPKRIRVAVATAAAGYEWTASMIEKDPMVVFEKKIKPSKVRLLMMGFWKVVGL